MALKHDLYELAKALARVKHADQVRKGTGEPYINHLARVAGRVDGLYAKTVAYLHDIIEDTNMDVHSLMRAGLTPDIVDDVLGLSRVQGEDYFDFIERGIRDLTDDGLYVKLADLQDNLTDDWTAQQDSLRARYIKADLMIRAALKRRGLSLRLPIYY